MDAILAWVKSMTKEQFEQAGLKASVEVVITEPGSGQENQGKNEESEKLIEGISK